MNEPTGLLMKYFVLSPTKADAYGKASREAMLVYAASIASENRALADDLFAWLKRLEQEVGE